MRMGKNDYRTNDKQRRVFFKYRRAGVVLTQSEVDEIKAGRKQLRREMKETDSYSRKEFELTASSLGLYFDKNRLFGLLLWLLHGRALWALLGAAALFFTAMYAISRVTEMRGHFTINLTREMFEEGFELSNTKDFKETSSRLYGIPVEDAPCISITEIPSDINDIDGPHNGVNYFAHTFYLAKRGEGAVDYKYSLCINSESLDCAEAIWVMLFCEDEMTLYAKANTSTNGPEYLPDKEDTGRGYKEAMLPLLDHMSAEQYETIAETSHSAYYRLIPEPFEDDVVITSQIVEDMEQDEVDKYTVVIWLEGDDPDCTNDLIGAHIGMHMDFEIIDD